MSEQWSAKEVQMRKFGICLLLSLSFFGISGCSEDKCGVVLNEHSKLTNQFDKAYREQIDKIRAYNDELQIKVKECYENPKKFLSQGENYNGVPDLYLENCDAWRQFKFKDSSHPENWATDEIVRLAKDRAAIVNNNQDCFSPSQVVEAQRILGIVK